MRSRYCKSTLLAAIYFHVFVIKDRTGMCKNNVQYVHKDNFAATFFLQISFQTYTVKTRTVRGSDYSPAIELSEQKDKLVTATGDTEKYSKLDLMFMKHYAPNRCLYIKVAKLRSGVGSAETSYLQNCSVKLFKEHFKVQICKEGLFEKK